MRNALFRKFTAGVASIFLAGFIAWPSLSTAQSSDQGPPLDKQLEAVHAYVARTREWSREDYSVKPVRAEAQDAANALPTFRVNLTSQRVRPVAFDAQFDVLLDSRSGEVVGENAQNPGAIRDAR